MPRLRIIFPALFILILIFQSGCAAPGTEIIEETGTPTPEGSSPTPTAQKPVVHEETSALSPVSTSTPSPTVEITSQKTHYNIEVEFDYYAHVLRALETITYTNNSEDSLDELVLMVESARYHGSFQFLDFAVDGETINTTDLIDNNKFTIPLTSPLDPGQSTVLSMSFEILVPAPEQSPRTRPIPYGYTERQTNLVDWYPYIAPYRSDKGWLANPPGYYGEHQVYDSSDFEISISLVNDPGNLTIAASAQDQGDSVLHRYTHLNARNFAFSVSHLYEVLTDEISGITVISYGFPVHKNSYTAVHKTTLESVELYSSIFGPYPRQQISVVEADFLDGMEYDGLYFLSNGFYNLYQGTPGEYLIAIAAHETAHQWWYALIGNDQALEPWLDEALCTYSERLFYENLYPEALDWWWAYRMNYYDPRGWVDDTIYNPHGYENAYRSYRDAIYLNGAQFLEDLRILIGDESFFLFLQAYTENYAHQIVDADTFFLLLDKFHQQDIQPLMDEYFFTR